MHFWAPEIDPAHPLECTQAERYVLRRLSNGCYIAIAAQDQSLEDVEDVQQAHFFHTHEAALRAAGELNRLGSGGVDVVKVD
jgi:porphobilinogen deaminase